MNLRHAFACLYGLFAVATWGCDGQQPDASDSDPATGVATTTVRAGEVTFNRDIAPLMFQSCSPCHRPGEAAPFSLLTYSDLKQRVQQVVEVTGTRYMPPWMPAESAHPLLGDRRLSTAEIALFAAWQEQGAPEGDPQDLPATPSWTEGWHLGEPDLVVRMQETYQLRADGADVFRQFVLPVELDRVRQVQAVEMRPGNKRIVHHANFVIDATDSSRRLDRDDPGPGFWGMDIMGNAEHPPGHLVTWVPGTVADPHPDGTAWRLAPGTDLVLQFHMFPSGKEEPIQPLIGLHFTDEPQDSRPLQIFLLENRDIDIPAGAADYVLTQSLVLPLPIELIGLYPHMHYLGKEALATATLPDGTELTLLRIPNWDFNWQDVYTFAEPVSLPSGTRLSMRYVFDNSTENVLNPSNPPVRVQGGNGSKDEMCQLWVQVRVENEAARDQLLTAVNAHNVQAFPEDLRSQIRQGVALLRAGQVEQAAEHYRALVQRFPEHSGIAMGMGYVWVAQGKPEQALTEFQRAVDLEPTNIEARLRLAGLLRLAGNVEAARQHLQTVIEQRADSPTAYLELGNLEQNLGTLEAAQAQFERVLQFDRDNYDALSSLGTLAKAQRKLEAATKLYLAAVEAAPQRHDAHFNLATVYLMRSAWQEAQRHFARALEIEPKDADARYGLGMVYFRQRQFEPAWTALQQVLEVVPNHPPALVALAELAERKGDRVAAEQFLDRHIQASPNDPQARCRLASLHVRSGKLELAEQTFAAALELQSDNPLAHTGLADIHIERQAWAQAAAHYRQALQSKQVPLRAATNLAWLLATCPDASVRNGQEAVETIQKCLQFAGEKHPGMLDKLAAAQAETGQFEQAVSTATEALEQARRNQLDALASAIEERLALYRQQQPYRLEATPPQE